MKLVLRVNECASNVSPSGSSGMKSDVKPSIRLLDLSRLLVVDKQFSFGSDLLE